VLIIFDIPDANASAAAAISGIGVASGAVHNVKLTRLLTQEEVTHVRQTAAKHFVVLTKRPKRRASGCCRFAIGPDKLRTRGHALWRRRFSSPF
jgi:hypothetical protein